MSSLPTDAQERKSIPIATGCFDYFPDALIEVAMVSQAGNDQHNPGEPLHWAREKSNDHSDCALRHFVDRGKRDSDGQRHSAKAAWRILAMLQLEIEEERVNQSVVYGEIVIPPLSPHKNLAKEGIEDLAQEIRNILKERDERSTKGSTNSID